MMILSRGACTFRFPPNISRCLSIKVALSSLSSLSSLSLLPEYKSGILSNVIHNSLQIFTQYPHPVMFVPGRTNLWMTGTHADSWLLTLGELWGKIHFHIFWVCHLSKMQSSSAAADSCFHSVLLPPSPASFSWAGGGRCTLKVIRTGDDLSAAIQYFICVKLHQWSNNHYSLLM